MPKDTENQKPQKAKWHRVPKSHRKSKGTFSKFTESQKSQSLKSYRTKSNRVLKDTEREKLWRAKCHRKPNGHRISNLDTSGRVWVLTIQDNAIFYKKLLQKTWTICLLGQCDYKSYSMQAHCYLCNLMGKYHFTYMQ